MTDTVYERSAPAAGGLPLFRVRETRDRRALEAAMSEDRAYAAYALGHLDPELGRGARFWLAEGESGAGYVMHGTAMGRTLVAGGDPAAVDAILSLHPGPRWSYVSTCAPAHVAVLQRSHALSDALHMTRMSTTHATFTAADGPARRLRGREIRALNALYARDGHPSHYSASHIERGVYYGAFDGERLVAAAGTHVVSPQQSIAVVGNVFTHPAYRGRGLGTRVTSLVTAELLDRGCALVTLTVDPANAPAVRAYARLGYEAGPAVVEARARRRDPIGLGPWLRRRAAQRRAGAHAGDEVAAGRPAPDPAAPHARGERDQ